mmetsp:Transcript_99564/g.179720  ORF Transcript_99564/g.179720 Transcript_99564/m.179720 type:complete len:106 (-) Transcript_99564:955-1272(-)
MTTRTLRQAARGYRRGPSDGQPGQLTHSLHGSLHIHKQRKHAVQLQPLLLQALSAAALGPFQALPAGGGLPLLAATLRPSEPLLHPGAVVRRLESPPDKWGRPVA